LALDQLREPIVDRRSNVNGWSFPKLLCCGSTALLFCAASAKADDITVDEQSQERIQYALDQVSPPGTVILPPGRYPLNQRDNRGHLIPLRIRSSDITLRGAGADQTVLFRSPDDDDPSMIAMVQSTGNARVRVTGIRFEGVSKLDPDTGQETSVGKEIGVYLEAAQDFRVDNCSFTHAGFAGVRTDGDSSGVVDHSTFEDNFKPMVNTDGYGVAVYGIDSEQAPQPFGSPLATFIEDSNFRGCRHAAAANKAGRYVFRYNYVAQNVVAHAVDAHGLEYGSDAGTEWIDVHDNLIEDPNGPCNPPNDSASCFAVHIRGGKGLVWNNQFQHYNQGIHLRWDTDQPTGPVYIYDNSLLINEGSHSRCQHSQTSPMFCAVGTHGTPTYELSPPVDYLPFVYPHPLVID
jgi:hypothetical protein